MARVKRNLSSSKGNRIGEIRSELNLSLEELARLVTLQMLLMDENNPEVTYQTIQRLEKGEISLSVPWMDVLAKAFNQSRGTDKYKPWDMVWNLQEFENTIHNAEESLLIERRRQLSDTEQKNFDAMTGALLQSILSAKTNVVTENPPVKKPKKK